MFHVNVAATTRELRRVRPDGRGRRKEDWNGSYFTPEVRKTALAVKLNILESSGANLLLLIVFA